MYPQVIGLQSLASISGINCLVHESFRIWQCVSSLVQPTHFFLRVLLCRHIKNGRYKKRVGLSRLGPLPHTGQTPPLGISFYHCSKANLNSVDIYSETSLIRHSMGPENNVGLQSDSYHTYMKKVSAPHKMVGLDLERMSDYRSAGLGRFTVSSQNP